MIRRIYYDQSLILIEAVELFENKRFIKAKDLKKYHLHELKDFMKRVNNEFREQFQIKPFKYLRTDLDKSRKITTFQLKENIVIDVNIDDIEIIMEDEK